MGCFLQASWCLVAFLLPWQHACGEVLVVQAPDGRTREFEAVAANWNQALQDAGQPAFAGQIHFDGGNPHGCSHWQDLTRKLVVVDSTAICGSFASTAQRAADAGALAVIFIHRSDGLAGIALGHDSAPSVRAVMIQRHHGEALKALSMDMENGLVAELKSGVLISEDAYEEHFILRADELTSTRSTNFLWHRHPEMLPGSRSRLLSSELMEKGTSVPEGWFRSLPLFVPLFNPSLATLPDGSLLASLRMSNGPGCPSVRLSKQSSMDTRIFHNKLVLAHLNTKTLQVQSHVLVETPPLSCFFSNTTQLSGRQFLDAVHGPMDARLVTSETGELWVSFYAERNIPGTDDILRGIHAAPLHVEWEPCRGTDGWTWHRDTALHGPYCHWLGSSEQETEEDCRAACLNASSTCTGVNFRRPYCHLRGCAVTSLVSRKGWTAGLRTGQEAESSMQELCLARASLADTELLTFPSNNQVEKNWNLIQVREDQIIVEYHVEPHIVLDARLVRLKGEQHLASLETLPISRWPGEVLHGVSNVRGGYCCLRLQEATLLAALPTGALSFLPSGPLLLGCGHLQRIRTPFDQAPGDVDRFRRQAKSRAYFQFFYALRPKPPFDVVAVSSEWCITLTGRFSWRWREVLSEKEEACEAIQFVGGLALHGETELLVAYGINDCEAGLLPLPLRRVLAMLRPVESTLNVSLDDGMI